MIRQEVTLAELNGRVGRLINGATDLRDVWVKAETSDVRVSGGHCYMELLQKDESTGLPIAKARAVVWSSTFARLNAMFLAATGSRLKSDMKVMVKVTVNYHAVYGMSLVISDIDPDYTAGDLVRRRNEIISRLKDEGVFDLNRTLPWNATVSRVAVISAEGAAGYGDFVNHLLCNTSALRFSHELFPAVLQGERTPVSVISALERIMDRIDDFDCVVIIRGGGAVSDLASFDDYDLAANVAQFPLPVIVGIGHERDVTVLDYVAARRVKTPTAAAELLIGYQEDVLARLMELGKEIQAGVTAVTAGEFRRLAYMEGSLPGLAVNLLDRAKARVGDAVEASVMEAVRVALRRARMRLDSAGALIEALSPESVLRRGFSITRHQGRVVGKDTVLNPGDELVTTVSGNVEIRSRFDGSTNTENTVKE